MSYVRDMLEEWKGVRIADVPMNDRIVITGDIQPGEVYLYAGSDPHSTRILVKPGGRIFVDGQETTDVERIGAAFKAIAPFLCPEKP